MNNDRNKMRTTIIIMLCLITWHYAYSQVSVPQVGATWYYSAYSGSGPGEGYYQMKYIADIEKGGKLCKQITIQEMSHTGLLSPGYDVFLLYEDRKIYEYIDNMGSAFYLLYDFNVKEGDKIQTSYLLNNGVRDDFEITVGEVRDTIINGETLVCYKFRNEDYYERTSEIGFEGVAIENIGNISDNYWFFPVEHYPLSDFWLPRGFRCYTSEDFDLRSKIYEKNCDWHSFATSLDTHSQHPVDISLQENSILSLNNIFETVPFSIFDIQGKKQLQGEYNPADKVDISKLNSGLYLLLIGAESQVTTFKFVKK